MRVFGSSGTRPVSAALLLCAGLLARADLPAAGPNVAGNCNGDLRLDLADGVFLLQFLFTGGTRPECRPRCDFEGDGALDVSDAVALIAYLVQGGASPAPLVLPPEACGDGEDNDCDGDVDETCPPPDGVYAVTLAWDEVTKDRTGRSEAVAEYRVYFLNGAARTLASEVKGATIAVLRGLRLGVSYTFVVTAVDAAGNESAPSEKLVVLR